jgi:hypothetical protein
VARLHCLTVLREQRTFLGIIYNIPFYLLKGELCLEVSFA